MKSIVYDDILKRLRMVDSYQEAISIVERLKREAEREENGDFDLMFLKDAHNLTSKIMRTGYHVKLYHPDWAGWFDWYTSTGTIVPNSTEYGSSKAIGKSKDAEEVGKIIINHIYKICT